MSFPIERPRRLRSRPALRRLARETQIAPQDLIYPLFVREAIDAPQPIEAMPGQQQHTLDSLAREVEAALKVGVGSFVLFGIPARKDAQGSEAWAEGGIVQRATQRCRLCIGVVRIRIRSLRSVRRGGLRRPPEAIVLSGPRGAVGPGHRRPGERTGI